jgi:hypothetical protein
MSPDYPRIVEFTIRALHAAANDAEAPTPPQIAAAFDQLCERLRTRLHPLFGKPATQALFGRALHLASAKYPWLSALLPTGTERCAPDQLDGLTRRVSADELKSALVMVLAHDFDVLSELVGIDLVIPLVEQAWEVTAPQRAAESKTNNE